MNYELFEKICVFVKALNDVYSDFSEHLPLALYARYLEKLQFVDKPQITHQIALFTAWLEQNRSAIAEQCEAKLDPPKMMFRDNIYINIGRYIGQAQGSDRANIWLHLAIMSKLADPLSQATSIIETMMQKQNVPAATPTTGMGSSEVAMASRIMSVIQSSTDSEVINRDPLAAIRAMENSGVLNSLVNDIVAGTQGGELNLNALMGALMSVGAQMENN